MIFIVLWTSIFAVLAIYLLQSPKVRAWLRILSRSWVLWRIIIIICLVITGITLTFHFHPREMKKTTDTKALFESYSGELVNKIVDNGIVNKDSSCDMSHAKPEIAYILPMVIKSYYEIVEQRPTKPVIARLDDTLHFNMVGYKQFKNRSILLNKLLRKKLGNRYAFDIVSEGTTHTLWLTYIGDPWDIEQLCALPVIEIARRNNVDPALLMSLIRHVSAFNFDYEGQKDARGILSLHEKEGLEQIELGAQKLSKLLQIGLSMENAVATFYPDPDINAKPEDWMRSPLTKSWVDQVLGDIQFYKDNGI